MSSTASAFRNAIKSKYEAPHLGVCMLAAADRIAFTNFSGSEGSNLRPLSMELWADVGACSLVSTAVVVCSSILEHGVLVCWEFWDDICASTAFSANLFLARSSGCLNWTKLHSGHSQLSTPEESFEIQAWQKLCAQGSVIRIGGVNMSFLY